MIENALSAIALKACSRAEKAACPEQFHNPIPDTTLPNFGTSAQSSERVRASLLARLAVVLESADNRAMSRRMPFDGSRFLRNLFTNKIVFTRSLLWVSRRPERAVGNWAGRNAACVLAFGIGRANGVDSPRRRHRLKAQGLQSLGLKMC